MFGGRCSGASGEITCLKGSCPSIGFHCEKTGERLGVGNDIQSWGEKQACFWSEQNGEAENKRINLVLCVVPWQEAASSSLKSESFGGICLPACTKEPLSPADQMITLGVEGILSLVN